MNGFIEVMGLSDKQVSNAKTAQEEGEQPDLSMLNPRRNLIAIDGIIAVTETEIPGLLRFFLPGATFSYALGTVADIAAKIAAAQAAPTHRDPALFGRPRIGIEGTGGVSFVRVCDITSIRPCQSGAARSIVYTRHHGAIASALESEAVERLIGEARSAWYGNGAA